MYQAIVPHRRRLLVAAIGFGALALAMGLPTLLVLLTAAVAALAAFALAHYLPELRHHIAPAGLGCLVAAVMPLPALMLPVVAGLLAFGLDRLFIGAVPLPALTRRYRARMTSPVGPKDLLESYLPVGRHPDEHVSGLLIDYDHDPEDAGTYYLCLAGPTETAPSEDWTIMVLDYTPGKTLRLLVEDALGRTREAKISAKSIPAGGTGVSIEVIEEDASLPAWLRHWFDMSTADWLEAPATPGMGRVWSRSGWGRGSLRTRRSHRTGRAERAAV